MILVLITLLLLIFGASAPAATTVIVEPSPVVASTPVVAECTVQPRTVGGVNEVASTARTPVPGTPTLDEAIPYVKPKGKPASGQVLDGVTATIEQFIACANAGEYLRILALFSDGFIQTYAADIGLPLAENDPLVTPSPAPAEDRAVIDGIIDVIELPDGRVSALATFSAADDSEELVRVVFTLGYDKDRERWLIDDFREVIAENGATAWTLVQGEGYEGVIVPVDRAGEFTDFFLGEPVENFWMPTEQDIAALERNMPSYLQTKVAITQGVRADFIDRLPEYKRQYAGFVLDGRNLILVNAFCSDDPDWRTGAVIVMDGGDCFFRVTYEPATGTFSGFQVNGEA